MTEIINNTSTNSFTKDQLLYDPKIRTSNSLAEAVNFLKKRLITSKVGLVHFDQDQVEPGDCVFLSLARTKCDLLIVLVPSDLSLRVNKKKFKFNSKERCFTLASLSVVDYVCVYDEQDPSMQVININPDIIFGGRIRAENLSWTWTALSKINKQWIEHPFMDRQDYKFFQNYENYLIDKRG